MKNKAAILLYIIVNCIKNISDHCNCYYPLSVLYIFWIVNVALPYLLGRHSGNPINHIFPKNISTYKAKLQPQAACSGGAATALPQEPVARLRMRLSQTYRLCDLPQQPGQGNSFLGRTALATWQTCSRTKAHRSDNCRCKELSELGLPW